MLSFLQASHSTCTHRPAESPAHFEGENGPFSDVDPHVAKSPRRCSNTPDDLLCSLYDASTSAFSLNSARLWTLPHIPCAAQDLDLGAPGVGSDVLYLAGHSSACCGHGAAASGGSTGYMRGTLVNMSFLVIHYNK